MKSTIRVRGTLATAIVIALAGAVEASAQTADVAGAWILTVESDVGITNPTITFEQDGMTLTGHYSSENLGEADLTGTREWIGDHLHVLGGCARGARRGHLQRDRQRRRRDLRNAGYRWRA